jgi:hypothetical protein
VRLPEDLLAELEAQAHSRGLTPDELAVETLRAGLRQQSWQAKAARWQEYGKASGYIQLLLRMCSSYTVQP